MPRYEHKHLRFDAPLDWEDRTIVSFAAPRREGKPITPNFVLTRDAYDDPRVSLEAFAEKQFVDISRHLREVEVVDRKTTAVSGIPAIEFRFRQKSTLGRLEQRLILFQHEGLLFTVTTTVAADEAAEQDPMFDRILGTFDVSTLGAAAAAPRSNGHVRSAGSTAR